ncbi:protease complex subunit PrcB family protein [Alkaliphilus serpentinus]|uniref:Protease complex subunit PrcB family protein n=1 Tax=Alkaliphilus serpentinus TaxID=1482731 RepID=A0A833HRK2_9FIRM|nr:protease complex subunit PrcB family protein [Alkaliphilus serpentinus]KAB3533507.1 protease complex subunit PrcB family protein [Alkaliphilus serpentinus]
MRRVSIDFKKRQDDVTYEVITTEGNKVKLVLHWGEKPTSGYKIKIKKVEVKGDEISIIYSKIYPAADAICRQVITYPKDSWEGTLTEAPTRYRIILKNE